MVRGKNGKGKYLGFTRGGGRQFSKNVRDGRPGEGMGNSDEDSEENSHNSGEEEDSEEEGPEEESSEGEPGTSAPAQPGLSRTERRKLKKQKETEKKPEEDEDPDLINPNHVQQKMNISDLNTPRELSRREREQKAKQEAKDRYWKLHVQGKTDEAKADLSRLAKIRAEREAAQAKRQAEAEAKAAEAEAKKAQRPTSRV